MNTARNVLGATSTPVYLLNNLLTHTDHAELSMARSTEPCGGWNKKASSPPTSSSSVFAYLFRMGVSASGSDAAKGPSVGSENKVVKQNEE
eukprot:1608612-Prymnesium_polylepis.1